MAEQQGHNFTAEGARRIVKTVREHEQEGEDLVGDRSRRGATWNVRRMKVTNVESNGVLTAQLVNEAGAVVESSPEVKVKAAIPHADNDEIIAAYTGSTDKEFGAEVVRWHELLTGAPIMCALSQTGGSNGNATTAPTWTYTATHVVYGTQLGTAMSPEVSRPLGRSTAATRGLGYMDDDGDFVLTIAFETPGALECDSTP